MVSASVQTPSSHILSLQCPDQVGVVARVSNLMLEAGAFITEMSNYSDPVAETFHLRCVFDERQFQWSMDTFRERFTTLAQEFSLEFKLRAQDELPRVLLAVSKYDHCLSSLLHKWRAGTLPLEIVGIVSNHPDCEHWAEWYGLPLYHFPITPESKPEQEAQIIDLMASERVDLLVLARYMQILSDDMCKNLQGRAINIHHSFLPGFKGAKPYHQAYERGVKVIGATAHYVTADLDEGPIIAQEVRAIDHQVTVPDMIDIGHDTEAIALGRAVRLHCEERVQLNGQRTVIL